MNGAHCVGALAYLQHTLQGFQLIMNHGHVNRAVKLYNVHYLFTLPDDQETFCGTSKGDFSTKGIPGLSLIKFLKLRMSTLMIQHGPGCCYGMV